MQQNNITKENQEVILKIIISKNESLYSLIKKEFTDLEIIQVNTILLLKLGYTYNEVSILLEVSEMSIEELDKLIINSIK